MINDDEKKVLIQKLEEYEDNKYKLPLVILLDLQNQ